MVLMLSKTSAIHQNQASLPPSIEIDAPNFTLQRLANFLWQQGYSSTPSIQKVHVDLRIENLTRAGFDFRNRMTDVNKVLEKLPKQVIKALIEVQVR
jgi:hypothetical protein